MRAVSEAQLFIELDGLLSAVVAQLTPVSRRKLTRTLSAGLRERLAKRIRRQQNPDGSRYVPRKEQQIKTYTGRMEFLWNGKRGAEVREIVNWRHTKGSHGTPMITGYDPDAGGFRSFKRADIEQYLSIDLNKTAIRRNLRRGLMFERIRLYRYLQSGNNLDSAEVGFSGQTAAIARIHQFGLVDDLGEHFRSHYPVRELLGFSDDDLDWIASIIDSHLRGEH